MSATATQPTVPAPDARYGMFRRPYQLCAVVGLNLRLARRTKRLWILAFVALLPAVVPFGYLVLSWFFSQVRPFPPAMVVFRILVGALYLHVVLYVLALVYGLAVVSDEVEGKTLIHLLLRPMPRWVMVLGKYVAAWLITGGLLTGSLLLTYVLVWVAREKTLPWDQLLFYHHRTVLIKDAGILLFALAAYLALFGCVGAWLRHGERWGVVFCFGWESLITYLPTRVKWLTLMYHVETLFPHAVERASRGRRFFILRGEPLSDATCAAILVAAIVVFLALTVYNLKRKEIR